MNNRSKTIYTKFSEFTLKHCGKLFIILLIVSQYACVPFRRQIIIQDLAKKNVKSMHQTDTVLRYQPFEYRLQPKDILAVSLMSLTKGDETNLNIFQASQQVSGGVNMNNIAFMGQPPGYVVNDSGGVLLPVFGKVKVLGLTVNEARETIQIEADKYFENSIVNIRLQNYFVYLMGEVAIKGRITSPSNSSFTLLQAISMAGGLTEIANRKHIKIIRTQNNTSHIYYVNLLDQDIITKNEIHLMPNDIVYIEPMRSINTRKYTLTNITLAVTSISTLIALYFAFSRVFQ